MQRRSETGRTLALFLLRSLVLYFLLVNVFLQLSDQLDLPFQSAAFLIAVLAALAMEKTHLRFLPSLVLAALLPFALRALFFLVFRMQRAVVSAPATDFLFFYFDKDFAPALVGYGVAWLFTFLALRHPRFVIVEAALNAVLLVLVFWTQAGYKLTVYPHPSYFAWVLAMFVLAEFFVLLLAGMPLRRAEGERVDARAVASFSWILVPLLLVFLLFLLNRYGEGAVMAGGGLMKPTLFRFDFAPYVRLESEIRTSDQAVMLFRTEGKAERYLLRRFVLSGYAANQGFFMDKGPDGDEYPTVVPDTTEAFRDPGFRGRDKVSQEYYFLTLDPSSLISLNYPVRVMPLQNWKSSSFLRVYRVDSRVMRSSAGPQRITERPDMPGQDLAFYTRAGDDAQIAALAQQVTKGLTGYYEKAAAIESFLKNNYLYSLKPGIAEDGNQLHHFLFVSKKGYCSYFAFAMALMCRSLGIPARVAVGFSVDPQSEVLNFYEVRAFQAHAWVEVNFGDLGWVEFDPTSSNLAPGEDFTPPPAPDRDLMAKLIAEIVKNQTDVEDLARPTPMALGAASAIGQEIARIALLVARLWYIVLPALFVLFLFCAKLLPSLPGSSLAPPPAAHEVPLFTHPRAAHRRGLWQEARRVAAGARREDTGGAHDRSFPGRGVLPEGVLCGSLRRGGPGGGARAPFGIRCPMAEGRAGPAQDPGHREPCRRAGAAPMRMRGRILAVLALALCGPCGTDRAFGQAPQDDTLEGLTSQAQDAITQNAFESAVKLLTEAKTKYPSSPKANLALGDLYYDKELYPLALAEYKEAEKRGATDYATLTQISRSYGKLNQDMSSIDYLTRILQQYPDSGETIDDLGWMYFKTQQLDKGEQVLLQGLKKLGMQRGMAMTLGTVYSGMNRYDQSRDYYMKSLNEALRAGDRDFAAIAYYNLSLLEHNFFHFNSALRFTEESIAMEDRPSGHLARGELFQSRMDFPAAEQEYLAAYAKDTTPLAKVNLGILYQKFGRLDLARSYGEQVLGSKDMAWLLYYGTDVTRHVKDLHELLTGVEKGLAVREAHRPTTGPVDWVRAIVESLRHRLLAWYHGQRFHALSLEAGTHYLDQKSFEEAWWDFYRGNESYPDVALSYLAKARALETARTPHALPYYQLEEGKIRHSTPLLEGSLSQFDPFWEKEPAADALLALIPLLSGREDAERRRDAIVQLYQINPGALPQAGIGLPFAIQFTGGGWSWHERALVTRFLRRAGSECFPGARFSMGITRASDGSVRWTVTDTRSGVTPRAGSVTPRGSAKTRSARLVTAILEELYAVH